MEGQTPSTEACTKLICCNLACWAVLRELPNRDRYRQSVLLGLPSDAIWHAETLFFNPHGVAKFILSRAVQDAGYKVVLTGEGSDEIVAGYPHFRQDLFRNSGKDEPELLHSLRDKNSASHGLLLANGDRPASPVLMERVGYSPAFLEPIRETGRKVADFFTASVPIDTIFSSFLDNVKYRRSIERTTRRQPKFVSLE
jgi:asparagine synthetase B (glutamine-hydrolysing)